MHKYQSISPHFDILSVRIPGFFKIPEYEVNVNDHNIYLDVMAWHIILHMSGYACFFGCLLTQNVRSQTGTLIDTGLKIWEFHSSGIFLWETFG